MLYRSTRGNQHVKSSKAIVTGIAPDGGLYVPESIPHIDLDLCTHMDYQTLAIEVLTKFLTDFSDDEVAYAVNHAYDNKFAKGVVPLKHLEGRSVLELYHGRTLAFKDIALSILPYLMKQASERLGIEDEIVILTATSGDTGKAALEGFADVEGTKIVVFYPSEGISDIQKHQMISQVGKNTHVFGIKGNFDDAQTAVKSIFLNESLKQDLKENGYVFSSANSINIGRLVPQIVYYIYGYLQQVKAGLIQLGDEINVVVPTGNFGNILAARYAKAMGLPIKKFICASNENNVLTDFIQTGCYDLNRPFKVTNSPSMDILISSNLERYLSLIGEDVPKLMSDLSTKKAYTISDEGKKNMSDFYGGFATEIETIEKIKSIYNKEYYLMDTHTAVAEVVLSKYRMATNDQTLALVASTASPYKFTRDVIESIKGHQSHLNDFELIDKLSEVTGLDVPEPIQGLAELEVLHPHVISKISIKNTVESILR